MKKIVQVTAAKRINLTPTQAAVIIALKRDDYRTACRFIESIGDFNEYQIDTLMSNVKGEYEHSYIYDASNAESGLTH